MLRFLVYMFCGGLFTNDDGSENKRAILFVFSQIFLIIVLMIGLVGGIVTIIIGAIFRWEWIAMQWIIGITVAILLMLTFNTVFFDFAADLISSIKPIFFFVVIAANVALLFLFKENYETIFNCISVAGGYVGIIYAIMLFMADCKLYGSLIILLDLVCIGTFVSNLIWL